VVEQRDCRIFDHCNAPLILGTGIGLAYSRGRHSRATAQSDAVGGEPESLGRIGRCSGCSGGRKCDREPVS
jgi:hypothetical protein